MHTVLGRCAHRNTRALLSLSVCVTDLNRGHLQSSTSYLSSITEIHPGDILTMMTHVKYSDDQYFSSVLFFSFLL